MKTIHTLTKLIFLLLLSASSISTYSQKQLELKPYIGYNITLGEFSDFSKNGIDFGMAADYSITKNWGLGLDFNQQINEFVNPFDFSKIPPPVAGRVPYNVTGTSEGKFSATTFGFGPWWQVNFKDIDLELYSKVGITMLKTPSARTIFEYDNAIQRDLFRLDKQNSTAFGITSGLRIGYNFNERISAFINPQYVYGANRVEYSKTDIDPSFVLNTQTEEVEFRPGLLLEQRPESYEFNPSYFNVNVGVTFRIGKPKPDAQTKGFEPPVPGGGWSGGPRPDNMPKPSRETDTLPENGEFDIYKIEKLDSIGITNKKHLLINKDKKYFIYNGKLKAIELKMEELTKSGAIQRCPPGWCCYEPNCMKICSLVNDKSYLIDEKYIFTLTIDGDGHYPFFEVTNKHDKEFLKDKIVLTRNGKMHFTNYNSVLDEFIKKNKHNHEINNEQKGNPCACNTIKEVCRFAIRPGVCDCIRKYPVDEAK